jgi:cyclopropane fatty-acyl-phospholipid synthase-like methyltransferase
MSSALLDRWSRYRARRAWDGFARTAPREVTATFDAGDWETYWASGERDLRVVLSVVTKAGLDARERAVEIGCGMGRITRVLAVDYAEVVGLDISSEMVARARQMSQPPNVSYALVNADMTLPVDTQTVDLVMAWTVFRHVSEDVFVRYAAEAHRVLRPGGVLAFEAQVRETGPVVRARTHRPFPEREYLRAELADHCRSAGFTWAADEEHPSATPGTTTLVVAWRKPASSS